MTVSEIAQLQSAYLEETKPKELTDDEKLMLMLNDIDTEPVPVEEPKLGYKWQMMYTKMKGFVWELVEDPSAVGTQKNPLYWIDGMPVKTRYWYTVDGDALYIGVADGVPSGITDTNFLEKL